VVQGSNVQPAVALRCACIGWWRMTCWNWTLEGFTQRVDPVLREALTTGIESREDKAVAHKLVKMDLLQDPQLFCIQGRCEPCYLGVTKSEASNGITKRYRHVTMVLPCNKIRGLQRYHKIRGLQWYHQVSSDNPTIGSGSRWTGDWPYIYTSGLFPSQPIHRPLIPWAFLTLRHPAKLEEQRPNRIQGNRQSWKSSNQRDSR